MGQKPWIGVDLDGTLAYYDHWRGIDHIGAPIERMVFRIRTWLSIGFDVKIFTARVSERSPEQVAAAKRAITTWLTDVAHLPPLEITNVKDFAMVELWDDRAVQVIPNTGETVEETSTRIKA